MCSEGTPRRAKEHIRPAARLSLPHLPSMLARAVCGASRAHHPCARPRSFSRQPGCDLVDGAHFAGVLRKSRMGLTRAVYCTHHGAGASGLPFPATPLSPRERPAIRPGSRNLALAGEAPGTKASSRFSPTSPVEAATDETAPGNGGCFIFQHDCEAALPGASVPASPRERPHDPCPLLPRRRQCARP